MPLIALSQKDDFTQTGNWIFQAFLTPRQQVRALVRTPWAAGIKRFAILYPDSSYGRTFSQNFQEEVARQGGTGHPGLLQPRLPGVGPDSEPPWLTASSPGGRVPGATALFIPDDAATVAAIAGELAGTSLGVQLLGTNLWPTPRG